MNKYYYYSLIVLLCVTMLATSLPITAQVIIAREEERCTTLLQHLRESKPSEVFIALPVIDTGALPFELPEMQAGVQPAFLFTSPRGVEFFVANHQIPDKALVMALGRGTERALLGAGYRCDLVSSVETTKGMAEAIVSYFATIDRPIHDVHFIQPTCDIAGRAIENRLKGLGATFTRVETYAVKGHSELKQKISCLAKTPKLILFYSPSGVRSWVGASELRPPVVSIGPVTSETLRKYGFTVIYESPTPHEQDLLTTTLHALSEIR